MKTANPPSQAGRCRLSNSDTSDLINSAFGLAGIATRGPLGNLFAYGTVTPEDRAAGLDAEWERTRIKIGDDGDIDHPDFYYYDIAEPSIGIGFMYVW